MADRLNIIQRAAFLAQATATMGIDPKWDAAVVNYVSWNVRANAQEEFGRSALQGADDERMKLDMEKRLGKEWRKHPEGQPIWDRMVAEGGAHDRMMIEKFYEPLWIATRELAAVPAPSFGAAIFKALLIEQEDLYNDGAFKLDCIELIDADLARFAMQEAA